MADPIDFGAVVGLLLGGLSLFLYGMEKMSDGATNTHPSLSRARALSPSAHSLEAGCIVLHHAHRTAAPP
jgi:hypothetical protein